VKSIDRNIKATHNYKIQINHYSLQDMRALEPNKASNLLSLIDKIKK
jgi:hypothetical protein